MKRRKYLQLNLLGLSGAAIAGLVNACVQTTRDQPSDSSASSPGPIQPVIIVGAGIAGLYAGYTLYEEGVGFQILEASDRVGGRLGKLEGLADFTIDLGAQWLHGRDSIVGELVEQTNTKIVLDESPDQYYWFKGALTDRIDQDIETLMDEVSDRDISLQTFLEEAGVGPEYQNVVDGFTASWGTTPDQVAIFEDLYDYESNYAGDDDYKFSRSYFDLINDAIAAPIQDYIALNTPIKTINYEQDLIRLTDHQGQEYQAERVIITVPITILQRELIAFEPPLPADKTQAFKRIGMDAGMKVWLKFSDRFFHSTVVGGEVANAYFDDGFGKDTQDHILMAFIMGDRAQTLSDLNDDEAITKAILTELDLMYAGAASKSFEQSYVQDWTREPYIQGAYSYNTVGMGQARAIAAATIEERIYFAGEAMNLESNFQTAHGAAQTGYDTAMAILELMP
jgi:lysine-specific histone demethylase 1B